LEKYVSYFSKIFNMEQFERLLGQDNPLFKSIQDRGFQAPSEIQEKSIPEILKNNDVIAGAATGSGKTLAFASGLIKNAKKDYGVQGLVLTPTRELAEQVSEELADFGKHKNLEVIPIYGGVSITHQIKRIPTAEIIVGTPGRVLDHLERGSIDLSRVNTLVLDEADRMLDMGFIEDVSEIISKCPKERQTLLFSATISPDIAHLAQRYMNEPVEVSAEQYVDPKKLKQIYYDVHDGLKYSLMKQLLEQNKSKLTMIFCNTRRNVDFLANNLDALGIKNLPLHGGFSQEKRNKMLEIFHKQKINILIATDVAARGLHIEGVSHVYNYDIPPTQKEYVHRIGRTARAGKEGKVVNILCSRDYDNFSCIVNGDFNIEKEETPYIKRVQIRVFSEKRNSRFSGGRPGNGNQNNRRFGNRNQNRGYGNRFNSKRPGINKFGNKNGRTNNRPGNRFGNNSFSKNKIYSAAR
jgi:ATP-dependent RNA helicase DeaD